MFKMPYPTYKLKWTGELASGAVPTNARSVIVEGPHITKHIETAL